ncbi:MAG: ABC transporter permease [Bacteroidota bacterium]
MFRNFFKITFRTLWKNKTYSFLNIFGLAIGIACAGLIFLWIENEKSYDTMYAKKNLIYNIRTNQVFDGPIRTFTSTPGPMAPVMKAEIPGIVNTSRYNRAQNLFANGDKSFFEKGCYADAALLNMLQLSFVQGSSKDALKELNSVVISQQMSNRLFGTTENVIGKTIKVDNKDNYIVSGIIKDIPLNSTFQFDWISPFEVIEKERPWLRDWHNNATDTYIELGPNVSPAAIDKTLYGYLQKRFPEQTTRLVMVGMNDWRLRNEFENGKQKGGRIQYIQMFTAIAWIILLIGCINFMNLATARSEKRAREVGVRKVLGAGKQLLIVQFIGEALFMALLAVTVGALIIVAVLPGFNILVEQQLTPGLTNPTHIAALLGIALFCGLVAGSYPALYLSSFKTVQVFKGLRLKDGAAEMVRKGLVVLQFTISIVFIISTILIYKQIQHIKSRDLGYNKDNLVSVDVRGDILKNFASIKQELLNTGIIENAGLNSFNTLSIGNNSSSYDWKGKDQSKDILISNRIVSPELIPTLGLTLKEGRQFNSNFESDSNNVIITESFAKLMGTESALGKIIQRPSRGPEGGMLNFTVIGVLKDFVYGDMYGSSDPVIFYSNPSQARYLYIRSKASAKPADVLAGIEGVLKKFNPAYPFDYTFVDDQFNNRFKTEMLISRLSRAFAGLAILISCLGLFGLSAYTAERRTKEIGIRKVLGASVAGITRLLANDFIKLVLIASITAFPIAWLAMNQWLQGYAYRIGISWWVFAVAGIAALLIALVTISFQAIKAALANPVKSLRTE